MKITKDMVGKKVRVDYWPQGQYCLILFVGDSNFFYRDEKECEGMWELDKDYWELYNEPVKTVQTVKMAQAVLITARGTAHIPERLFESKEAAQKWGRNYGAKLLVFPAGPWIDVPIEEESK